MGREQLIGLEWTRSQDIGCLSSSSARVEVPKATATGAPLSLWRIERGETVELGGRWPRCCVWGASTTRVALSWEGGPPSAVCDLARSAAAVCLHALLCRGRRQPDHRPRSRTRTTSSLSHALHTRHSPPYRPTLPALLSAPAFERPPPLRTCSPHPPQPWRTTNMT